MRMEFNDKTMEIKNGIMQNNRKRECNRKRDNGKNGIREWTVPNNEKPKRWKGPEKQKKWDIEMERSRTMGKMEIGMEWSPTKEIMEIRNGTVPNNGKYRNQEWNGPEQWKIWKSEMERSRTMK